MELSWTPDKLRFWSGVAGSISGSISGCGFWICWSRSGFWIQGVASLNSGFWIQGVASLNSGFWIQGLGSRSGTKVWGQDLRSKSRNIFKLEKRVTLKKRSQWNRNKIWPPEKFGFWGGVAGPRFRVMMCVCGVFFEGPKVGPPSNPKKRWQWRKEVKGI